MADLKKLDEIVEQLGSQSEKLANFSAIYAELDKIKVDLEANITLFGAKSKELDKASDLLQSETKTLTEKLNQIQGAIMQRVDLIDDSNKNNHKELQSKAKEQAAKLTEIHASLMIRIDLIEESNKKFQRDLDSDITSKLVKHKSDIKVTVREEGKATAETIENKLNTTFLKELNNINKKTGFLMLFAVLIVGLNIFLIQNLI